MNRHQVWTQSPVAVYSRWSSSWKVALLCSQRTGWTRLNNFVIILRSWSTVESCVSAHQHTWCSSMAEVMKSRSLLIWANNTKKCVWLKSSWSCLEPLKLSTKVNLQLRTTNGSLLWNWINKSSCHVCLRLWVSCISKATLSHLWRPGLLWSRSLSTSQDFSMILLHNKIKMVLVDLKSHNSSNSNSNSSSCLNSSINLYNNSSSSTLLSSNCTHQLLMYRWESKEAQNESEQKNYSS